MRGPCPPTLGVVLAGGLARRLGGGDKGLRLLGGRSILERAAARLRPQVAALVLNANGDPARFAAAGLPVVADGVPGRPGPLAGVLAGLDHAAAMRLSWVLTVPADAPFLPGDLAARLHAGRVAAGAALACAASGGRTHPAIGLWPVPLREALRGALGEGVRQVGGWAAFHGCAAVPWPAEPVDPFFNVNTPGDLAAAEAALRAHPEA